MDKKFLLLKQTLILLLIIIFTSLLFLSLYHFNNKYTNPEAQAINGALYISRTDWINTPIRYLRNDWRYYNDRFLTPKTLKQQSDNYQYVSIGEETNFSMRDY